MDFGMWIRTDEQQIMQRYPELEKIQKNGEQNRKDSGREIGKFIKFSEECAKAAA